MAPKKSQEATQKSPAEFFAENRNIAGFDNAMKSLYTSVRELVENALDAAESIEALPDVSLTIEELSEEKFRAESGISGGERADMDLYTEKDSKKRKKGKKKNDEDDEDGADEPPATEDGKPAKDGKRLSDRIYKLTCEDNGCGMRHDQVPKMLGVMLSGSKYVVRQSRGKFGIGAKMVLIYAKQTTGQTIKITTAHSMNGAVNPTEKTFCELDINMKGNDPKILRHERLPNPEGWRGSKVEIILRGKYSIKIKQYMTLLAVITPYARLKLDYLPASNPKAGYSVVYERRSNEIRSPPQEVKYHPKSVDNLIVQQLLDDVNSKKSQPVEYFLANYFSSINKPLAKRLVEEFKKLINFPDDEQPMCKSLTKNQVHQLAQLLRETAQFPDPSADCLSPATEYNLHLGVQKEFDPDLVATGTSKPGSYMGHPFVVEAALALGGSARTDTGKATAASESGISVHRFANRIPLLFEGGSDVMTVVTKELKWKTYLIDPKANRVNAFISIVSTKIPFKGTGKEYIGADIDPIKNAVQEALRLCAQQLRSKLSERRKVKERDNKAKSLRQYVSNVSRSFVGVIRQLEECMEQARKKQKTSRSSSRSTEPVVDIERTETLAKLRDIEKKLLQGNSLTADLIETHLHNTVTEVAMNDAMEVVKNRGRGHADSVPVFLIPRRLSGESFAEPVSSHPFLAFRLLAQAEQKS